MALGQEDTEPFRPRSLANGGDPGWLGLALPPSLGAMGATLSAMMNFAGRKEIPDVFTSFWVTLVRPLIGAVSGLVAVLVFSTDLLNVDFSGFMFAAFAFGFSERLVLGAIDKLDFRKATPLLQAGRPLPHRPLPKARARARRWVGRNDRMRHIVRSQMRGLMSLRPLFLLIALLAVPAAAAQPAKQLFGAKTVPADMAPAPIGSYVSGCLAGAVELPETGPSWQAMRLRRNRNWGHPNAIAFIERLGAAAQRIGWPRIYVGDISQPRGGPMRTGHTSHQTGLDIDIWFRRPEARLLSPGERERIGSPSVVARDRRSVNGAWTAAHHALLKAAAEDPAVARIFVNAAVKRELCNAEPPGADRGWLAKVRPWWKHESHFHVRLNCPAGAPDCVEQDRVPRGDGCDASLAWWFSDEALNPKPGPSAPRTELRMADLPPACAAVLAR